MLRRDVPPGSALLRLHLRCKRALSLPPLGPPVLEPDLERRHTRNQSNQNEKLEFGPTQALRNMKDRKSRQVK